MQKGSTGERKHIQTKVRQCNNHDTEIQSIRRFRETLFSSTGMARNGTNAEKQVFPDYTMTAFWCDMNIML